jgi:hypothetical protein
VVAEFEVSLASVAAEEATVEQAVAVTADEDAVVVAIVAVVVAAVVGFQYR